jgi:HK97 family phage major capsid protein
MSIQALREERAAVIAQARKILDDHPGAAWTDVQSKQVDRLYAKADTLEAEIRRYSAQITADMDSLSSPVSAAWRNVETGEPMAVVGKEHAGRIASVLGRADRPQCSLGDFLRGVAGSKLTEPVRAALSVGTDGSGGYAVPSWLFPEFIEALLPVSSLLQAGARVVPLPGSAKTYRFARVASVPTAAWRSEAGAVAESDPAFTALDLTPQSLAFFFKCSRELLMDSPNIDAILPGVFAGALAAKLDATGLRGTGTPPEPRGLGNISGIQAVTNGTNGATQSSLKWANLNSAYQAILDANGPPPTAVIQAPRSLVGFSSLVDSTAQPLQRPSLLAPLQFIGTSQVPVNLTVGSSTDCTELFVGDFSHFVIGMREQISILRADQLYAATGQVGFFVHARVDFGCHWPAAFAKISGVRAG